MRTSECTSELIKALVKAKLEIPKANKSGKSTAFNKSGARYSTVDDVLDACLPSLSKYGIVHFQSPEVEPGQLVMTTRIMHESDQFIESVIRIPLSGNTVQNIGSAITYAKRYTLISILGISCGEEDDDDGNAASNVPGTQHEIKDRRQEVKPPVDPLSGTNEKHLSLVKEEMLKYLPIFKLDTSNLEDMKVIKKIRENIFAASPLLSNYKTLTSLEFDKHFGKNESGENSYAQN